MSIYAGTTIGRSVRAGRPMRAVGKRKTLTYEESPLSDSDSNCQGEKSDMYGYSIKDFSFSGETWQVHQEYGGNGTTFTWHLENLRLGQDD